MLKRFDIFPKAYNNELRVKTKLGGALTILSMLYLIINILAEIKAFAKNRFVSEMTISNTPLPQYNKFYVDIDVYNNCNDLHVDFTNQKRTFNLTAEYNVIKKQNGNKCNIIIKASAPSVPGSFHVGLGRNYVLNERHAHQYITIKDTNLSHTINTLEIGDSHINGSLDGSSLILKKPYAYMINYDMQLIPIISQDAIGYQVLGDVAKTNLENKRGGKKAIAGIVFNWNFSPLQLTSVKSSGKTFISLVSHIFGIFGTFFVFVRWIDMIAYSIRDLFNFE